MPALLDALDGECPVLRSRAISVLSLIRDSRAWEPIVAQLLDREVRVRVAAALALARFPCSRSVPTLERALRQDGRHAVRLAALQSLIALFEAGFEEAVVEVVSLLFEQKADRRLRYAALGVIPLLPPRQSRGLLRRLRSDPNPDMAAVARKIEVAAAGGVEPDLSALPAALLDLASPRPERWNQALHRLVGFGEQTIAPLVEEMLRRSRDPEYCTRAGMVLRGLGPRRARPIVDWLERVDDPLPLEVLVEAVGGLEDKPLIYRLKDVIDRLRERERDPARRPPPEEMQRVRARCHLQLARIGSRVAIDDLKDCLGSPDVRIPVEMLAAVERIGKRDELLDLLRAWRKEEPLLRSRIRDVFLLIARREKVRRTNRIFSALCPEDRAALEQILEPAQHSPSRPALSGRGGSSRARTAAAETTPPLPSLRPSRSPHSSHSR